MTERTIHLGNHAPAPPSFDGRLRVVTWNIKFGAEVDAAVEALGRIERLRYADVLLLQEMDEGGTDAIASALELNFAYVPASIHSQTGRNFGNAVLSRWPLTDPHTFDLPHKALVQGEHRLAVGARIAPDDVKIQLYSVHTETPVLSSAKRKRQFETLAASAALRTADRLIIGGDFNTVTKRGIRRLTERMDVIGAMRVSAASGPTLRRGGRNFTMDHLFARGCTVIEAGVGRGTDASDHVPVWAELDIHPVAER